MSDLPEKIEIEIWNENYITAAELLLEKYRSSQNSDHLETIHNILSHHQISSRFSTKNLEQLKNILRERKFGEIGANYIDNKVGVAEFPVVGENNTSTAIRGIVVKDGTENVLIDNKIYDKRELYQAVRFVQEEIQKNLCDPDGTTKDVTILNWGLTINIRDHLLKKTKHEPKKNNVTVKGTSLHFASVAACVSKIFKLPINSNYIFSGAFDNMGEAQRIEGLKQKFELITKERPKTKKIFIPPKSKFNEEEKQIITSSKIFVEVNNINQLIEKVFDKSLQELAILDLDSRRSLGRARIWAEYIGKVEINFFTDYVEKQSIFRNCAILNFMRPSDDSKAYKIFPIDKIYHQFNSDPDFIIINGGMANHYMGNIISSNQYRAYSGIFGIRDGPGSQEIIIFASRDGSGLAGYRCKFQHNFIV